MRCHFIVSHLWWWRCIHAKVGRPVRGYPAGKGYNLSPRTMRHTVSLTIITPLRSSSFAHISDVFSLRTNPSESEGTNEHDDDYDGRWLTLLNSAIPHIPQRGRRG